MKDDQVISEQDNISEDNETFSTPPGGHLPVDLPQKPDYIPENFWVADKGEVNIEALSKSYHSINEAMKGTHKPGKSVEDYTNHEANPFKEGGKLHGQVDESSPVVQAAYKAAAEAGMSPDQAHSFISDFYEKGADLLQPVQYDMAQEFAMMEPKDQAQLTSVSNQIHNMFLGGEIDAEAYQGFMELGTTPAGARALIQISKSWGEAPIPVGEAIQGVEPMTLDEWYGAKFETHAEAGESREAYNDRMNRMGRRLIGDGRGSYNGAGKGVAR